MFDSSHSDSKMTQWIIPEMLLKYDIQVLEHVTQDHTGGREFDSCLYDLKSMNKGHL